MNRKSYRLLSLLLLLSLLASACTVGDRNAPEPSAGLPAPTLAPTESPLPSATPLPLPAPRLLFRSPAPGEEQLLDAPLELVFDQPMDRASVEAALVISPTVEGSLAWVDDRTLSFAAENGLERGAAYEVTVSTTARNVEGKPLAEPLVFPFQTVGFLAVSQVMPAPGAADLDRYHRHRRL